MRLALAFMCQNEKHWISLHLPVWLQSPAIDGVVALDGGSYDGSASEVEWICGGKVPCTVAGRRFDWNFSAHGNALITLCEQLGYTTILRMDPDELMHPEHITGCRMLLENGAMALCLPRIRFIQDRLHYDPAYWPDLQARAWQLNCGVYYGGTKVHETVGWAFDKLGWKYDREIVTPLHFPMYHYEGIRTDRFARWMKHENFRRLLAGEPVLETIPEGFDPPPNATGVPAAVFEGPQPLDPAMIGLYAPFEEVIDGTR